MFYVISYDNNTIVVYGSIINISFIFYMATVIGVKVSKPESSENTLNT